MSRFWTRNRRGVALAAAAAAAGLLGYLAYEVWQESARDAASDDDGGDSSTPGASDVEDVIHVRAPADTRGSSADIDRFRHPAARRVLAISARGVVLDSADADLWSADVRVRRDAAAVLARLAELYAVYLIVAVRPGADGPQRVLRSLELAGIVTPPSQSASDVGDSVVWVGGSSRRSSGASSLSGEIPSSAVSAILNASPGILPRANVLFCQTEEGKAHMARHLLTAAPPPNCAGYAGYVDTNRDVVARLSHVLHTVVLVAPHAAPCALIRHGDVPGANSAFSAAATSAPSAQPSGSRPPELAASAETVDHITNCSLYR
ncbi:hypothetical protein IWW55_005447 [Coemansia sp. RSA 2706]|nr:hypothetical protein IWW55_005447 [Coemansia sp. RSA 2706]KAJ2319562.1 hypothetical protein IWW51_004837 [Coemansia sp. RSA 2702]KAJ2717976.1 hypothetical protein H4R23_005144 [Coemansia sp. Cherry 401B]